MKTKIGFLLLLVLLIMGSCTPNSYKFQSEQTEIYFDYLRNKYILSTEDYVYIVDRVSGDVISTLERKNNDPLDITDEGGWITPTSTSVDTLVFDTISQADEIGGGAYIINFTYKTH